MKDKEPKIHPLVKVGSALSALALAASQVGCKPLGVESPPPEGTQTNSTEVVPPPSSTVEATAPASIQPMVQETPVAGATSTPEAVSPAVWAPPTLEQMVVTGYGGELSPDVAVYEFDKVIATGLARVGIENTAVNFSDNGLSGNDYFWAPLVVNSEGSVVWAYDPAIGQLEWPVKLDIISDAQGMPIYSLHTEGLSYQTVLDSEGAQIVWGGTKDEISGKYLAILAKDPITLPDGRQIYSIYWDRTSQSWLSTPGLAELLATPTPDKDLNYSFSSAITPEKLQAETNYFSSIQSVKISDDTERNGWPFVYVQGHIVAYQLNSNNGERFLYALLVTKGGVLKAKIDYVYITLGPEQPLQKISELTYAEASKISDYLNKVLAKLEETDSSDACPSVVVYINAINSEGDRKTCVGVAGVNSEQICSFDSSLAPVTPAEMEAKIRSAIVSVRNQPAEEVLEFKSSIPLLSIEGNAFIWLQVPVIH